LRWNRKPFADIGQPRTRQWNRFRQRNVACAEKQDYDRQIPHLLVML